MVSNAKRMRYVSENEFTSSEGEAFEDKFPISDRKNRASKWLSKNAIMARENRRKKKLYVTNLEKDVSHLKTENVNFSKVIEKQSLLIKDLKKEIKYLKSVIANSKDIGNLIKSIRQNTGMSVSTSLDQSLSLNYVSKSKQTVAMAHPWEEKSYPRYPTPESDFVGVDFGDDLLNTVEIDEFLGIPPVEAEKTVLNEHNYTSNQEPDVGVCLHVSKQRVSLEFCSSCSDNASQAWND